MPKQPPPGYTRCPHCNNILPEFRMTKHIRKVHGLENQPAGFDPQEASSYPIPKMDNIVPGHSRCLYCRMAIADSEMENHINLKHRSHPEKFSPSSEAVHSNPVVVCPVCKLKMLNSQYEMHRQTHEESIQSSSHKTKVIKAGPGVYTPSSTTDTFWHRDSDGGLWIGTPPGHHRQEEQDKKRSSDENMLEYGRNVMPENDRKTASADPSIRPLSRPKDAKPPVVTCPICKSQVLKTAFRSHVLKHSGITSCPACNKPALDRALAGHMATVHPNWCPICRHPVPSLEQHLEQDHFAIIAVSKDWFYRPSWQNQKSITCYVCLQHVSPAAFIQHQTQHGLLPRLITPKGKKTVALAPSQAGAQLIACPLCKQTGPKKQLIAHLSTLHPYCPHCMVRFSKEELQNHIQTQHSDLAIHK